MKAATKRKREIWSREHIRASLNWFQIASRYFIKMKSLRVQTDKSGNHNMIFWSTGESCNVWELKEYIITVFNEKEELEPHQIKERMYSLMMEFIEDRITFIENTYWQDIEEGEPGYWSLYPPKREQHYLKMERPE